ncbi:MAG: hypothetical protein DMH00_05335 [Acidobacteria bacterium]|nr:MAG: hypothetical protein DMH00_05335 [Acidobacteriota bacterium]
MERRRGLIAAAFGLALGGLVGYLAGAKVAYLPVAGKSTLEQETLRLETEYPLAVTKKPYLILDLLHSRLDYRISGLTTKSIPFQIDSLRERGREGGLEGAKWMILSLADRGAPPEKIIPPDPNKPLDPLKDPKLFPPDPPTDFTLVFDRSVKVRFFGEKDAGWKGTVQGVGRTVREWLPWGPGAGGQEIRVQLRLPAARAQEIYRALYRGETVLVLGLGTKSGSSFVKRSSMR